MTSTRTFVEFDKTKHDRKTFDCGTNELNSFLRSKADEHRKLKISRTMVLPADQLGTNQLAPIQAYYTTSSTTVKKTDIPDVTKRMPPYPVPVYVITCLAVSKEWQRQGLGKITLIKALENLYEVSKSMPAFAVVIEPIDARAENLYRKYGFQDLENNADSRRLFLPMGTLEALFSES